MDMLLSDELTDVLCKETEIYNEILKISHDKTGIIVEGRVSDLENLTRKEQALIFRIADLEDKREKIVSKISGQSGQSAKETPSMSISTISSMLPQGKAQKLNDVFISLSKTLKEIKEANNLNSKLIKNSLDYIDFSINLLTGTEASGSLYSNSGRPDNSRKRNFLDVKL